MSHHLQDRQNSHKTHPTVGHAAGGLPQTGDSLLSEVLALETHPKLNVVRPTLQQNVVGSSPNCSQTDLWYLSPPFGV